MKGLFAGLGLESSSSSPLCLHIGNLIAHWLPFFLSVFLPKKGTCTSSAHSLMLLSIISLQKINGCSRARYQRRAGETSLKLNQMNQTLFQMSKTHIFDI